MFQKVQEEVDTVERQDTIGTHMVLAVVIRGAMPVLLVKTKAVKQNYAQCYGKETIVLWTFQCCVAKVLCLECHRSN